MPSEVPFRRRQQWRSLGMEARRAIPVSDQEFANDLLRGADQIAAFRRIRTQRDRTREIRDLGKCCIRAVKGMNVLRFHAASLK